MKKNIKTSSAVAAIMLSMLYSCTSDPNSPGLEYMPDMYRSPSFETYGEYEQFSFNNKMEALPPVENTIPRGYVPFGYANDNEGYELAGQELKTPFVHSKEIIEEGKVLYEKYCLHCHGKKGEGDGQVAQNSDFINPPSYTLPRIKALKDGHIYHTIYYGKGMMGAHASQVNHEERWKIIHYVRSLQGIHPTSDVHNVTTNSDSTKTEQSTNS